MCLGYNASYRFQDGLIFAGLSIIIQVNTRMGAITAIFMELP